MQAQLGWDAKCWKDKVADPVTHDHYFHSALSLARVKTRWQQPVLPASNKSAGLSLPTNATRHSAKRHHTRAG
jgi:hypothetical protein